MNCLAFPAGDTFARLKFCGEMKSSQFCVLADAITPKKRRSCRSTSNIWRRSAVSFRFNMYTPNR